MDAMRISLAGLDARMLALDLEQPEQPDAPDPSRVRRALVRAAEGLAGTLVREGGTLRLEEVRAAALLLDAAHLALGTVLVEAGEGTRLANVEMSLEQRPGHFALDLRSPSVELRGFALGIGELELRGTIRVHGFRLSIGDEASQVSGDIVEIESFELRTGNVALSVELLAGTRIAIGWGKPGFRLGAESIKASALRFDAGKTRIRAHGFVADDVAFASGGLTLAHASVASAEVTADLFSEVGAAPASRRSERPRASQVPRTPWVSWTTLDRVAGNVDVDVDVDLTVPILGHRKATHRLRVPVELGTIDYRALESDLATLENSLLDFSVRDRALVLERGIPLLPTRGRGKPIVIWDLSPADVALAERNRVRLAVLPSARLAREQEEPEEPRESGKRSFGLEHLGLLSIDVRLSVAQVESTVARNARDAKVSIERIDSLVVQGNVFHDPAGEGRPGSVLGEASNVALSPSFSLGQRVVAIGRLVLLHVTSFEVAFAGLKPTAVRVNLEGASLDRVTTTLSPARGPNDAPSSDVPSRIASSRA
ncbi:hypothetical protein AKJ09_01447 [Labilithrix luteola]|uniref:Uncharacterized protein n=1 Tax=Labilithrix luteola TaxID=1391654 RepID=A0A0K1PMN3_9BACT|nr:hypothetical protein AKJ09_01447 [Labilithrix luteola]